MKGSVRVEKGPSVERRWGHCVSHRFIWVDVAPGGGSSMGGAGLEPFPKRQDLVSLALWNLVFCSTWGGGGGGGRLL